MKINKLLEPYETWKVMIWVMPGIYIMNWARVTTLLVFLQPLAVAISAMFLLNTAVFSFCFNKQRRKIYRSIVNVTFINNVISRKLKYALVVWSPLSFIGFYFNFVGFLVLSMVAMWSSAFVFLFSCSLDFKIISPYPMKNVTGKNSPRKYYDCKNHSRGFNHMELMPIHVREPMKPLDYEHQTQLDNEAEDYGANPTTGLPMINDSYDIGGNFYGFNNN